VGRTVEANAGIPSFPGVKRAVLRFLGECSFLLSQVIAAIHWILDVLFRLVVCGLVDLAERLRGDE